MWNIHAFLCELFSAADYLVAIRIDLVVHLVEEVGLGDQLDHIVQVDRDMWNLLLVTLKEVSVYAAQYRLVRNHDDWVGLSLNPVNHRLKPADKV